MDYTNTLDMHQAEIGPSYMFSGNKLGEEWHRLTAQNEGFKNYLNGKLTLAPLENPRSIIDMGAGTGAWAADAATIYPEAEVLAVDMSPFPDRNFPSNLKYQQFNLLDEFPWRNESFDVIHMRFLMYHIPYGAKFIARVVQLLKPGGFLIIEDSCLLRYPDGIGPAQQKQNEISIAFLHSRGLDPYIGSHLEEFMQATGAFEVISARMEPLCLNPLPTDPLLRPLAEALRNAAIDLTGKSASSALKAAGITPEIQATWKEEMDDPRFHPTADVYFIWGQKQK